MRAFIFMCDEDGDQIRPGTLGNWVSAEYKNLENLLYFGFKGVRPGKYRIEAFHDWNNRFGIPDIVTFKRVEKT